MKKVGKSSKKGFTLVELIVVLVILAILAAMLVPALVGYIDRAKKEKEFQAASTVYTAAQAAVTKYCTANGTKNTKSVPFGASVTTKGQAIGLDVSATGSSVTLNDFGDYLGDQFVGDFSFKTGASGDTVEYAVWSQDTTTLTVPTSEDDQIAAYKAGTLVGVHPQYPVNS